ncbi:Glutathionyl-hydroquinone reductase YqjG [Galdieria sulphuraria]|nr:Glutathionyl-hydroquinone reductase YqjG [Galdieria sulphuraria]
MIAFVYRLCKLNKNFTSHHFEKSNCGYSLIVKANYKLPKIQVLQIPWLSKLGIATSYTLWKWLWNVMVSQLAPKDETGEYKRPISQFRNKIEANPEARFPLEKNRYSLYVGFPCPWCHRVLLALALCNWKDYFHIEYCEANISDGSWKLRGGQSIRKIYRYYEHNYRGRCTLPLLVDNVQQCIVNNESSDIVQFLMELLATHHHSVPIVPIQKCILLEEESKALVQRIHENVNNGVYKAGFAQSQKNYESALMLLFDTLDEIEKRLEKHSFVEGNTITTADIYLFPTMYRFKAIYGPLFKCLWKDIPFDYPFLYQWLQRVYSIPGIAETCDLEETKQSYYKSLFPLNPSQIVPKDSEEQCSLNTDGDNHSSSLTNTTGSSEALLVPLVNTVTQQLFQLETLVKNATEISKLEDIYESIQHLVTQLQQLEQQSNLAQGSVPLDLLECIDRGENPSFYTLAKLDQWKKLESERQKKMEAVGWFRDCLRKQLEEQNISWTEYGEEDKSESEND